MTSLFARWPKGRTPSQSRPAGCPLLVRVAFLLGASFFAAGCRPVADAGNDRFSVGFDKEVQIGGPATSGQHFSWTQVEGPPVKLSTPDRPTTRFRTHPIAEVVALSDYPGPLAIPPTTRYTFRLEVKGRFGKVATDEIHVAPTSVAPGTGGVPLDTDAYLNGGLGTKFRWRLTAKPDGSLSQIVDPLTRTPHIRPDKKGGYSFVEEISGYNNFFFAGPFDDVPKDCGRPDCHAREEESWKKTRHANVHRHEPACVRCHTVAFDPGSFSGGFDDACPNNKCEPDKEVLGVIHCLACHGPGFRSAANFAEGTCAQCHDFPPKYTKVAEWRKATMARLTPGLDPAVQSRTPGCPDCHSAQGFIRSQKGNGGRPLGLIIAAPIGCPVCHDPHSATNPHQLRIYGSTKTRSGLALENVGAAALCATCHNAGMPVAEALAESRAPHSPQVDVLLAQGTTYTKRPDLCVDCHVRKEHGGGGHSFIPRKGTPDIKAVQDEIQALLARAREVLDRRAESFVGCAGKQRGRHIEVRGEHIIVTSENGHDLGDCDENGKIEGAEKSYLVAQAAAGGKSENLGQGLVQDAYDYFLLEADGSLGYHNPVFARAVLERIISEGTQTGPGARPTPKTAPAPKPNGKGQ